MVLSTKVRPLVGPVTRFVFTNGPRTFTSHIHIAPSYRMLSSMNCTTPLVDLESTRYKQILFNQIRFESSTRTNSTTESVSQNVTESPIATADKVQLIEKGDGQLDWVQVTNDSYDLVPLGAVLPFTKLNFLQQIFFPYTYALMYYLDYLCTLMPWWSAIVLTTATARSLFFPLVVRQNIIGIKANNVLPETQKIQKQLNEAMSSGDAYGQAIAKTKLQNLFKEHGITMKDRLLPIFLQAPLYMSFFFLLRNLATVPIEGLKTGGVLWFTDLTVPDPYFILPLMTSASMFILMEFGLEGGANPAMMTPIMKYVMRGIPVFIFAVTYSFPSAVLLFWSTSNLFTLAYAMIMKTAVFKRRFNVPARRKIDPSELPLSKMSIMGQINDAKAKAQATKTTMDVRRLDDLAFRKAGIGPLRKTYKESPNVKPGG